MIPEVFAKANLAQFPSRFLVSAWDWVACVDYILTQLLAQPHQQHLPILTLTASK